jgi:hypothetical protein
MAAPTTTAPINTHFKTLLIPICVVSLRAEAHRSR